MVASIAFANSLYAEAGNSPRNAGTDFKILGTLVKPHSGIYVVLSDVNVRAKPLTRSKRLGRLKAGSRVNAVGRVYRPILMPVIEGALSEPLKGKIVVGSGRDCNYKIQFLGKTEAKGLRFEFADFEVQWVCKKNGQSTKFNTPMFLSEGPHKGTQKPVHQITIDILELESGLEEVFSTHFLWDRGKGKVFFDTVNINKFIRDEKLEARPADDMTAAFNGALYLAASSWKKEVWSSLIRKTKNR